MIELRYFSTHFFPLKVEGSRALQTQQTKGKEDVETLLAIVTSRMVESVERTITGGRMVERMNGWSAE